MDSQKIGGMILVEFDGRTHHEQGILYLTREIQEALGTEVKITPNDIAALIYPRGADYGDVIRSVELILGNLRLRASPARRGSACQGPK